MSSDEPAEQPPHITDDGLDDCNICDYIERHKHQPIQVVTHLTKVPIEPDSHTTIRWNNPKLLEPAPNFFPGNREQSIEEHDHSRCAGYSMTSTKKGQRCKKTLGPDRARRLPNMLGTGQVAYVDDKNGIKVARYFCASHMATSGLNRAALLANAQKDGEEEVVVTKKSNVQKTKDDSEKTATAQKSTETEQPAKAPKITKTEKPAKAPKNTDADTMATSKKPAGAEKSTKVPKTKADGKKPANVEKTSEGPKTSKAPTKDAKAPKSKTTSKKTSNAQKGSKGKSGSSDPLAELTELSIPANERLSPEDLIPADEDEKEALELQGVVHTANKDRILQHQDTKIKELKEKNLPKVELRRREKELRDYFDSRINRLKKLVLDMIDAEIEAADEIIERPYSAPAPKQAKQRVIDEENEDAEMQEQTVSTETEEEPAVAETVSPSKKRSRDDFEKDEATISPTTEEEPAEPVPVPARKKAKTKRVNKDQESTTKVVTEDAPVMPDSIPEEETKGADGTQEPTNILQPIPEEEPETPASAPEDENSEKVDTVDTEEKETSSSTAEEGAVEITSSRAAEVEAVDDTSNPKSEQEPGSPEEENSKPTYEAVPVTTEQASPGRKRKAQEDLEPAPRKVAKLSAARRANDETKTKPSDGEMQSSQTAKNHVKTTETIDRKTIGRKSHGRKGVAGKGVSSKGLSGKYPRKGTSQPVLPDKDVDMEDGIEDNDTATGQEFNPAPEINDEDDETVGRKVYGAKFYARQKTIQQNRVDEDSDMEDGSEDDTTPDQESDDGSETEDEEEL